MTPAIRAAGDRGALIELPDSAAARSPGDALWPAVRISSMSFRAIAPCSSRGRAKQRPHDLEQLAASALASGDRRPNRRRPSRSRWSTTAQISRRWRGSSASRPRRWSSGMSRPSTSSRSSASCPASPICSGGDERLEVPRLPRPRERVPAGSVAIAGPYSGVYPRESPGGWRLHRPHLAGAVRPAPHPARTPRKRRPGPLLAAVNEVAVVRAGLLTTVQDRGRPGLAQLGVPPSGAADQRALELGNRIVGNDPDAAALEATLARAGAALRRAGARCGHRRRG